MQANSHEVSIIIPSRNVKEDLKNCLTCIFDNYDKDEYEVIVSDSNSKDGTVKMIAEHYPRVKVQTSPEVGSYASSINRGIEAATGQYLLFLDSDAFVQKQTISGLLDFLKSHPEVGAVVCKTLYPDGSLQLMLRRFPTPLNSLFGGKTFLTRLFPGNKISRNYTMINEMEKTEPFEIDWASSACMMIRREILDNVGLMDEGYLMYWADADYCRRIKDNGWKIYYLPEISVVHFLRNTPDKRKSYFAIKAFHQGVYRYFRKHCTKSPFHPLNLVAFIGLSARAALQLLLNFLKPRRSID